MKKSLYVFKTLFLAVLISTGFSLMAQAPEIELQQPTGGEHWTGGGTYLISWLDNFHGTVDVLYGTDGLVTKETAGSYEFTAANEDMDALLDAEYPGYVVVDWDDLAMKTEPQLDAWIANLGLVDGDVLWVVKGGNHIYTNGTGTNYHYRMKYLDGSSGYGGAFFLEELFGKKLSLGAGVDESHPIVGQNVEPIYTLFADGVSGSTCYWDTDGLPLGSYVIKVRSHNVPDDDTYASVSGYFQLVYAEDGEIKVLEPNGNESWAIGSTHLVSWNDNLNEPVDIFLVDGANTQTIATDIEGTTYEWYIEDGVYAAGTNYKIKVASSVNGATTLPDMSNNVFSITLGSGTNIKILQPNKTNIKWAINTKHLISWNDDVAETVNVYYKKTGGSEVLIDDEVEGTTLVWDIDIAEALVGEYVIIVRSSLDPSVEKISKTFNVTLSEGGTISVLQPNKTNIKWAKETSHLISWIDDVVENVNVYYMPNLGDINTDVTLIDGDVEGTTLVWDIPDMTGDYQIVIKSILDPSVYKVGKKFTITASAGTDVTIIQPSINGIKWQNGTEHLISWTDDFDENVTIELWDATGTSKVADIADDVWGSTYSWLIDDAAIVNGTYYKIKIYSPLDNNIADFSNKAFEVVGVTGDYIHIFQPNGGEEWTQSLSYYISWEQDFIGSVNVELYKFNTLSGNYEYDSDIDMGVDGSTTVWTITQAPGNDVYKVRVSAVDDQSVQDFSNQPFTILPFVMMNAYPNPTSTQFTLEIDDPNGQMYQVTLRDRFNNEVYTSNVDAGAINSVNISTQDLPNGVYFLNVISDTYNRSEKIIVNHR